MVPEGWDSFSLSQVSNLIDCKHRTPKYVKEGVPVISPGTIKWGAIDLVSPVKRVTETEYLSLMDHCHVERGDLVLSRNQSVGIASYIDTDESFVLGQDTVLVKPESCDPKFLFYNFQSVETQRTIFKLAGGSTFSRINLGDIRKLKSLYPPLPEQRKIAKILSTWDKTITTTEKLIATSKQQKKALMQQLLTGKKRLVNPETGQVFEGEWLKGVVGNHITFSGGAQPPRSTFVNTPQAGYIRLIQIRDYKTNNFLTYIPIDKAKKTCTKEDVMIGRYGPPIFQILRGIEGAYNVALIKAIPSDKLDIKFMFYFLCREPLFEYIESFSRRTSGQTGIEMDRLKEYPLMLPSLNEQQKIAQVLTTADKEIERLETKLTHLQQEKKALMQQLLTGKRRVKVDEAA